MREVFPENRLHFQARNARYRPVKDILERTIDITTGYIESSKPLVIVLIAIGVTMGMINGYRYFQFAKSDPRFCELCHIMNQSYTSWQVSSHSKIECQKCHATTLIEQNRLLLSYVVSGQREPSQKHGRIAPWNNCRNCHGEGANSMITSYGYSRPVICPQERNFLQLSVSPLTLSKTIASP
jgi:hypothetical protein